jgi:flagellar assembly protein FliH
MSDIINSDESNNVTIQKYQFGKLEVDSSEEGTFDTNLFKEASPTEAIIEESKPEEKSEEFTALLEKVDILTEEIVTLQIELENQKKSQQEQLDTEIKEAFDKGKVEGIQETSETFQNENDELKSQLIHSITVLEEQKNHLDEMFKNIEEDLIDSAILIAKKVIKKELEIDSAKVAISIATALVETLKSVGTLTIKVNTNDFKEISEHFNGDSITIVADEAISRGGVVILSNSANIDGTISTRLNKAMELIGKE